MPFETAWMDLEVIMPREINQTEKDKQHMASCILWHKLKKKNQKTK